MCKNCESRSVYEFTNKRKLCSECFMRYFQKKVFFTIRKFGMIKQNEVIGYESGTQGCIPKKGTRTSHEAPKNIQKNIFTKGKDFREVVLEDVLKMFAKKGYAELIKLHSQARAIDNSKLTSSSFSFNKKQLMKNIVVNDLNNRAKRGNLPNKIAVSSTIDLTAYKIVHEIMEGDVKKLNVRPVEGKVIKPLYLFLDKEVLLYAKLRKLKFEKRKEKEDKVGKFINELEKKHPEIKRAVVNGWLKMED